MAQKPMPPPKANAPGSGPSKQGQKGAKDAAPQMGPPALPRTLIPRARRPSRRFPFQPFPSLSLSRNLWCCWFFFFNYFTDLLLDKNAPHPYPPTPHPLPLTAAARPLNPSTTTAAARIHASGTHAAAVNHLPPHIETHHTITQTAFLRLVPLIPPARRRPR